MENSFPVRHRVEVWAHIAIHLPTPMEPLRDRIIRAIEERNPDDFMTILMRSDEETEAVQAAYQSEAWMEALEYPSKARRTYRDWDTLREANCRLVARLEDHTVIVCNNETGKYEKWVLNTHYSGYKLKIGRGMYEFVGEVPYEESFGEKPIDGWYADSGMRDEAQG